MGIRRYRGQIVCDRRWPDGTRMTRVCPNRTQAKALLARIDASVADGTWRDLQERLRLRGDPCVQLKVFSETYLNGYAKVRNKKRSWQRKQTSFNMINKFMGKVQIRAINAGLLHSYVQWRKKRGASDATINRDLTIVKHMLNYAVECKILRNNPVEKFRNLKEELKERQRFTEEQIQKVIGSVNPIRRPVFRFIRETGCRREEALSLKWGQVQEAARLVVFTEDTKSRKYRYVPLTEAAIAAIHELPLLEECPYVFYDPVTGKRLKECRKAWEIARDKAGVPELQVKDLRRDYAIRLAEAGADMHDIQQVLGHSSVATTEKHYAQFSPRHSARKILCVLEGKASQAKTA